jgi:hypothetical protein
MGRRARILTLPRTAPALAELLFPPTMSISKAKEYIYRELQELPVQAQGRGFVRELEREKQLVLKAIKEIEFDYQMRKISERDYRDMIERYRNRAMRLISELDAGGDYRGLIEKELKLRLELPVVDQPASAAAAVAAAPATSSGARPKCATCQTENDPDAKFCKSCGGKL